MLHMVLRNDEITLYDDKLKKKKKYYRYHEVLDTLEN